MPASTQSEYSPISCDFYDILELVATERRVAHVRYLDDDGGLQNREATIQDLYSHEGAEYVALSTGEKVRLDRLIAVDKDKLADYAGGEVRKPAAS